MYFTNLNLPVEGRGDKTWPRCRGRLYLFYGFDYTKSIFWKEGGGRGGAGRTELFSHVRS